MIIALVVAVCGAGAAHDAEAQTGRISGGRFEISGGAGWIGSTSLGDGPVTLTGSGVPEGAPLTLFETDTTIDGGPRFEARVGWRLTRALTVEGGLAVNRTHLTTRISGDFENAPSVDATERFTEYAIEGGILLHLHKLRFAGGRGRPFVTGGAGYLRQVHEGATLIETGQSYYAGGGVTLTLRETAPGRRALMEGVGLRADARFNVRSGGFERESDPGASYAPSVTAGVFVRF